MAKQQEKPGAASKAVHPDVEELMAHLEPTQNIGNLSRLGLPNEVVEKELNKALKIIVERRGIDYIDDYDRDLRLQIAEFFSQSSVHQGLLLLVHGVPASQVCSKQ